MGTWQRMQSVEEQKKLRDNRERIRGFMPFTEGANVEGKLEVVRIKEDGSGFFLIRLTKSAIVSVQDDESKSGQGKAQIGELVGIRKTGATKILRELKIGTLVSISYVELQERTAINPKTHLEETNPYHHIIIEVYRPDTDTEGEEAI